MRNLLMAVVGLAGALSLAFRASADLEVSAAVQIHAKADFYEPLAAQGAWIEVGSYGRCWRPAHVAVEWRPYSFGHWVWTDCGWYWASHEPWGWACYHYGSWAYDSDYGWIWVPDIEWAPAWVYWREGGGYIGWAPCPPRGVVVDPAFFVFVDLHRFHEPLRPAVLMVKNTTILNKTTQTTELKRETRSFEGRPQQVMINNGPGVDVIQKATGKKLSVVPIREAAGQTPVPTVLRQSTPEPTGRDRPPIAPERPNSAPEHKLAPDQPPARPSGPEAPRGKPSNAPKGKGGGSHGRDGL